MSLATAILVTAVPFAVVADLGHPNFARRQAATAWCRTHLRQPHPLVVAALAGSDPEARRRANDLLGPWPSWAAECRPAMALAAVCLYWPCRRISPAEADDEYRNKKVSGLDWATPPEWIVDLAVRPDVMPSVARLAGWAGATDGSERYYWQTAADRTVVSGCLYLLRHRATGRSVPMDTWSWWGRSRRNAALAAAGGGLMAAVP